MNKKCLHIYYLLFFLIPLALFSQNNSIQGIVYDSPTSESIPMVNIVLKKANTLASMQGYSISDYVLVKGTVSDINGFYQMNDIEPGKYVLEFSFIGYTTKKENITLKENEIKNLDISLVEESSIIDVVVISAGKFEQKLEEVTVSMDVIKPTLLESKNSVSMESLMNQAPGVSVIDGQANIRGGSGWSYNTGSRVLVMIDDMPFLSGERGSVEWDMIPMENIAQIEVIKGASSALFGSSALNGVINIRTEYPKDKPKTVVSVFQGFYDEPRRESLHWWGDSPQYFSGMSFSHAQYINNTGLVFGGNIFNDFGYQKGVENRRGRFNFNTIHHSIKIQGLSHGVNGNFMYSHNDDAIMYTNDSLGYIPLDEDPANFTQMLINIDPFITFINPLNNTKHALKTRVYRGDYSPSGGDPAYSTVFYADYQFQKTWDDITANFLPFNINHLVSTSGITRNKIYAHDDDVYGEHTVFNYSFYSQADTKIEDKLNLSLGFRYEHFTFDDETISTPLLRTGLSYQLFEGTFLRGSFGSGFRYPSIIERYVTTHSGPVYVYPNPDLKPEGGWSGEIGLKQGIMIDEWKGFIDIAGFIMQYDDMIEFTFGRWDPGNTNSDSLFGLGFKCVNIGESRISGLELSIGGNGKIGDMELSVLGSYTYVNPIILNPDDIYYSYWQDANGDGIIEEDPAGPDQFVEINYNNASSDTEGNLLKYRNKHLLKFDIQADTKHMSFGISARYNSFMQNVDGIFESDVFNGPSALIDVGITDSRQRFLDGDLIFDTRFSVKVNPKITLSAIIDNFYNVEYQIRPAYLGPPRTFTVKLVAKI